MQVVVGYHRWAITCKVQFKEIKTEHSEFCSCEHRAVHGSKTMAPANTEELSIQVIAMVKMIMIMGDDGQ